MARPPAFAAEGTGREPCRVLVASTHYQRPESVKNQHRVIPTNTKREGLLRSAGNAGNAYAIRVSCISAGECQSRIILPAPCRVPADRSRRAARRRRSPPPAFPPGSITSLRSTSRLRAALGSRQSTACPGGKVRYDSPCCNSCRTRRQTLRCRTRRRTHQRPGQPRPRRCQTPTCGEPCWTSWRSIQSASHRRARKSYIRNKVLEFVQAHTFHPADFTIRSDGACRLNPQMARCIANVAQITEASYGSRLPIPDWRGHTTVTLRSTQAPRV